jgi:solute carrier family 25 carnitine/acylcarnitine transporter 20/29
MSEQQRTNEWKNFIAGGVGGTCTVFVGHPFDTVKVRLQTMPTPKSGENPLYKGMVDCFGKTLKHEGIRGLYKGMATPIMAAAPNFALMFMGNGIGKKLQQTDPSQQLTAVQLSLAGALSGVLTTALMAPGDRIKCLLQIQQGSAGPPKYKGPIHVATTLYNEGGIRSIYKGTVATLLRDVPGNAVYFGSYEIIRRMLKPEGGDAQLGVMRTLFAGGMAGFLNWLIAIPADVVKSRLQTAPDGTYRGVLDVCRHLAREGGPKAYFKGAVPVLLRSFPANAFCFLGYEITMHGLNVIVPE